MPGWREMLLPDTQVHSAVGTAATKTVTVALADLEVSAAEVAVTVTVAGLGTLAGVV